MNLKCAKNVDDAKKVGESEENPNSKKDEKGGGFKKIVAYYQVP